MSVYRTIGSLVCYMLGADFGLLLYGGVFMMKFSFIYFIFFLNNLCSRNIKHGFHWDWEENNSLYI